MPFTLINITGGKRSKRIDHGIESSGNHSYSGEKDEKALISRIAIKLQASANISNFEE